MHTLYLIILLLSVFSFVLMFVIDLMTRSFNFIAFGLANLSLYFFLMVLNR